MNTPTTPQKRSCSTENPENCLASHRDVEKGLFLKLFGVPDWALTYVLGHNDSCWYRQTETFGRYNLVGSTVKAKDKMPKDLLADEKHAKAHGGKYPSASASTFLSNNPISVSSVQ